MLSLRAGWRASAALTPVACIAPGLLAGLSPYDESERTGTAMSLILFEEKPDSGTGPSEWQCRRVPPRRIAINGFQV